MKKLNIKNLILLLAVLAGIDLLIYDYISLLFGASLTQFGLIFDILVGCLVGIIIDYFEMICSK